MSDLTGRLRRLLFLVPYVARDPDGVKIETLVRELGVERAELLADLDLLAQVGPPAGAPDEYLLVSVEAGKVFVDLPQRLTRPLRLTPAEGCSLLLGLRALRRSRAVRSLMRGPRGTARPLAPARRAPGRACCRASAR